MLLALEDLLTPNWRCSARAVAFGAKSRSARKPAGYSTATLADWALVIGALSIRDHALEYNPKMCRRETRTASISWLTISIAASAGLGLNRRRVHRPARLCPTPYRPFLSKS